MSSRPQPESHIPSPAPASGELSESGRAADDAFSIHLVEWVTRLYGISPRIVGWLGKEGDFGGPSNRLVYTAVTVAIATLWEAYREGRPLPSYPVSWVYRVARYLLIREERRLKRMAGADPATLDTLDLDIAELERRARAQDPLTVLEHAEAVAYLEAAVDGLPPLQRAALRARANGPHIAAVAAEERSTPGAVSVAATKGAKKIRTKQLSTTDNR